MECFRRKRAWPRRIFVTLFLGAMSLAGVAGCHRQSDSSADGNDAGGTQRIAGGTGAMTREDLLKYLRDPDETKLVGLGRAVQADARSVPNAVVTVFLGADERVSGRAQLLLAHLDDLAIVPLVEAPNPSSADQRAWMMIRSVKAELALRQRIIARLDKMLDDRAPLENPSFGPTEKAPPRRRVCDEAYALMRQIVHFGESKGKAEVEIDVFMNSPDKFKDAQIEKARKSATWNQAITEDDVVDYLTEHPESPGTSE
jgi:hypothetical protein